MATLTTSYQMLAQKYLGNSHGDLYVRIYAKYSQQEISNNRTKVQYQARAYFSGNWIRDNQGTGNVSGTLATTVTGACTYPQNGETVIATTEAWVTHGSDGKKTISASAYLKFPNWGWSGTASGAADLPTIPRQAIITDAPNFHDEENPTIKYSNPAGDIVTSLEACISLDGSRDDVPYRAISLYGTSYTFELTEEERTTLRKATTGSNSRSVLFFVRTKIGGNTLYSTLKKMMTIIDGLPTLSPAAKDINEKTLNLTGDENIFVRNHSIAEVSVGAEAYKEATISTQNITCGSKTIDGAGGTIEAIDSGNIVFRVTDSRNNTVSETLIKKFVEYIDLTCDLKANAPDAEGDMNFTISGKCFNGSFGRKENSVNVYYRYKVADSEYGEWIQGTSVLNDDNTYIAEISLSGLDYTKRHTFQARAEDMLMLVESVEKTVSTIPLFDWGEKDFRFNIATYLKEAFVQVDGIDTALLDWFVPKAGVITAENNVFGIDIQYFKIGKLVSIIIDSLKMNKIPKINTWSSANIATLPDDIIPVRNACYPVVIDHYFSVNDTSGASRKTSSDSHMILATSDGNLSWMTRYDEANFTSLGDGYRFFATIVYVTK